MNRTPPIEIRRLLRREVGFGCPVPDCANPYLSYHQFAPPRLVHEHHSPEGMIALCPTHRAMAEAGAFTKAQLRQMKHQRAPDGSGGGRFAWLCNELVIEFHELANPSEAAERHPQVPSDRWTRVDFPVTVVEVRCEIGGTGLGFGPTWTKLPGLHLTDGFFVGAPTAILIS